MSLPRLGLTSTIERCQSMAGVVGLHGCASVILPCVEVEPADPTTLETARAEAQQGDWLLLTSPRSVAILWPDGSMPRVKTAVVGEATADAVRRAGGDVAAVGDSGLDRLVETWANHARGQTVFFPHSASSDLARLRPIEGHGARVVTSAIYDTKPIPPGTDPVEGALFASPSAVAGWALSRGFDDLVIAAIGETTAQSLADRGHPPEVVSPEPNFETLIGLTARHLRDRSPV